MTNEESSPKGKRAEQSELPDAHFGSPEEGPLDWRKYEEKHGAGERDDDDDEELSETPADVIAMLGFDPLEAD